MKTALTIIQIILSLSLSALIFLQSNGDTESKSNILSTNNFQKRGWEKMIYIFTIFVLAAFLLSSIVQTII